MLPINRVFATLFAIGGIQSFTRWLELLAFGVYVFDQTQSAVLVTCVTLVKFAPLALFGPVFGALPSHYPSRSVYLGGILAMLAVNLAGLVMLVFFDLTIPMVFAISFAGGLFWVLDFPVRRTLIGDAVAGRDLGKAMAIDTIANNGTRMLGPLLGGVLLQFTGLVGTFVIALASYSICLLLTRSLTIGRDVLTSDSETGILTLVANGGRLVQRKPLLLAILLVTVIYNLFAFPLLSLVPVIGRDNLALSPGAVGLLASMEGAGTFIGSFLVLRFARAADYRRLYAAGLFVCFVSSVAYAYLNTPVPIGFFLLTAGVGSAGFAAMQTTLLILNSDKNHRAILFGLLSLSIGTGLVGFALVGTFAHFLGVRPTIFMSGIFGVMCLALICRKWPEILQNQDQE